MPALLHGGDGAVGGRHVRFVPGDTEGVRMRVDVSGKVLVPARALGIALPVVVEYACV